MKKNTARWKRALALFIVLQLLVQMCVTSLPVFADRKIEENTKVESTVDKAAADAAKPEKLYRVTEKDYRFDRETGRITGLKKDFGEKRLRLVIPEEIEGVKVTEIADFAFIREEFIRVIEWKAAKELRRIGDYAFAFVPVVDLDLSELHHLEEIGKYAFLQMKAENIKLPEDGVLYDVGEGAFANQKTDTVEDLLKGALKSRERALKEKAVEPTDRKDAEIRTEVLHLDLEDKETFNTYAKQEKQDRDAYEKAEKKRTEEREAKAKAEAEAKAKAETEAKAKAEAEAKAKAEAEAKKKEQPERTPVEVKSETKEAKAEAEADKKSEPEEVTKIREQMKAEADIEAESKKAEFVKPLAAPAASELTVTNVLRTARMEPMRMSRSADEWTPELTNQIGNKLTITSYDWSISGNELTLTITAENSATYDGSLYLRVAPGAGFIRSDATLTYTTNGDLKYAVNQIGGKTLRFQLVYQKPTDSPTVINPYLRIVMGNGNNPNAKKAANVSPVFTFRKNTSQEPTSVFLTVPGYTGNLTVNIGGTDYPVSMTNGGPAEITNVNQGTAVPVILTVPDGYELAPGETASKTMDVTDVAQNNNITFNIKKITPSAEPWNVKIVETGTTTPVAGVTVHVTDDTGAVLTATTGSNGIATVEGMFTAGTSYTWSAEKDGYNPTQSGYPYTPGQTVELPLTPIASQSAEFHIRVVGTDGVAVNGAEITVRDDDGNVLSERSGADGKLSVQGKFTDGQDYEATILKLPNGYFLPAEPVSIPFHMSKVNPGHSTESTITVEKTDVMVGDMNFSTNVPDSTITVNIYHGKKDDPNRVLMHANVQLPPNQLTKLSGFTPMDSYSVEVIGSTDPGYPVGANTDFIYKAAEPNLKIYLEKGPTGYGVYEFHVHLNDVNGPLTTLMDGRELLLNSGSTKRQGTFQGGKAVFTTFNPGDNNFWFKELRAPEGYKLIGQVTPVRFRNNGYQDWVLVSTKSDLYLRATPPKGMAFPPEMTVTVADARTGHVYYTTPIGDGRKVFKGLPQNATYNITYQNVPEGWTHENALTTPVTIPDGAVETAVRDSFGYKNPNADKSIIAVYVTDQANRPLDGYTFEVVNSGGQVVATLTTDATGSATKEMDPKLPAGTYTVRNTRAKQGFSKVNDATVVITDDKPNIHLEAKVGPETPDGMNLTIKLLDPEGKPIPFEWLELYRTDGPTPVLVTDQIQTYEDGSTFIRSLTAAQGTKFEVRLKDQESAYEIIPEEGQSFDIGLTPGTDKNVTIHTRVKPGLSRIKVKTVQKNGQPAENIPVKITGPKNLDIRTGLDGEVTTGYLPTGTYRVEIQPNSSVWNALPEEERVKTVVLTEATNPEEVIFTGLEKKLYELKDPAGSIKIEGSILGQKATWAVTVTKFATSAVGGSAPGAKRGPVNTIRFSDKEMTNPENLKLMINGVETPLNGNWIHDNGEYIFVDDRSDRLTADQDVYVYTFDAGAIPNPPKTINAEPGHENDPEMSGHTLHASTKIVSNVSNEVIPEVKTAKKLVVAKDNINMSISGKGQTDDNLDLHWKYDVNTESVLPGIFRITVDLDENEPQIDFTDPFVTATLVEVDENGNELPNSVPATYDKQARKLIIDLPVDGNHKKKYVLKIDNKARSDVFPDGDYTQHVKLEFLEDPAGEPVADNIFTAHAPRGSMPPGETLERLQDCNNPALGKHAIFKVFLQGVVAQDGRSIDWVARYTNVSKDFAVDLWPVQIHLKQGEGLGPIENINMSSLATPFPFIDSTSFVDHANPDNKAIKKDTGLVVNVNNRDMKGGVEHPLDKNYWYKKQGGNVNTAYLKRAMPYLIKDGNDWKKPVPGSTDLQGYSYGYQRTGIGDYVEITFTTQIEDFSRIEEGYHMESKLDVFTYNPPAFLSYPDQMICTGSTDDLVIKRAAYQAQSTLCDMNNEVARMKTSAELSEDGQYLLWKVEAFPVKTDNLDSVTRYIKYNIEFVDEQGRPYNSLAEAGLELVEVNNRNNLRYPLIYEDKNETSTVTALQGKAGWAFEDTYTVPNCVTMRTIKTRMIDPTKFAKYRARMTGTAKKGVVTGWLPFKKGGQQECFVEVDGLYTNLDILKRWQNIYVGQKLPEISFEVLRTNVKGEIEVLPDRTLTVPANDNRYEWMTEGDFPRADGVFRIAALPNFDDAGNRYTYAIREKPVKGYTTDYMELEAGGRRTLVLNTREEGYSQTDDPTKYAHDLGTYPEDYRQDGPDVRNALTQEDFTELGGDHKPVGGDKGKPYKISYEDSIIGKSGQQTKTPGEFDMKLTVEGKGGGYKTYTDIVFVMDNSGTMRQPLAGYTADDRTMGYLIDEVDPNYWARFRNSKMTAMREYVEGFAQQLYNVGMVRIGLVNFATKIQPVGNYTEQRDGTFTTREQYQNVNLHYARPSVPLQNRFTTELRAGMPKTFRSMDRATGTGAEWVNAAQVDAQTNVQAGIREGVDVLQKDGRTNKKILVIVTDGAPSAHYRLENPKNPTTTGPMDTLTSGYYWFRPKGNSPLSYRAGDLYVTNHGLPAIVEMDYWKKQYPDMEVFTFSVDPQSGNDGATPEEQISFLKQLCSDPNTHHYTVNDKQAFVESMEKLTQEVQNRRQSIVNGTVKDPMGKQVHMKDVNGDGKFTIASTKECLDGDYYVEYEGTKNGITERYHLNPDGTVGDRQPQPGQQSPKLFENLPVYESQLSNTVDHYIDVYILPGDLGAWYYRKTGTTDWKLMAPEYGKNWTYGARNNLKRALLAGEVLRFAETGKLAFYIPAVASIGVMPSEEEVRPYFDPVRSGTTLDTVRVVKDGDGWQMNGLYLGSNEEVRIYYKINFDTSTPYVQGHYYQANQTTTLEPRKPKDNEPPIERYFPIPSVKAPGKDISLTKVWKEDGQPLTAEEIAQRNLVAGFDLIRYRATAPYVEGQPSVKDPNTGEKVASVILNKDNAMTAKYRGLQAYDPMGHEYFYEFVETQTPPQWHQTDKVLKLNGMKVNTVTYRYTKEKGSEFISDTGQTGDVAETEITNSFDTSLKLKIRKVNESNIPLANAAFALYDSNNQLVEQVITSRDGEATFGSLDPGTYTLREVKAPDGYIMDVTSYTVKVDRDAEQIIRIFDAKKIEKMPIGTTDDERFTFEFVNRKLKIPHTGSIFGVPVWILASGLAILAACGEIYRRNRRQGGDGDHGKE